MLTTRPKTDYSNLIKQIVSNIRAIREEKNYSQEYLAKKMSVSQNAYSKIELNYSKLTVARLIEIAEILDTPLSELVETNIALKKVS